jgi:hypothetical protein
VKTISMRRRAFRGPSAAAGENEPSIAGQTPLQADHPQAAALVGRRVAKPARRADRRARHP